MGFCCAWKIGAVMVPAVNMIFKDKKTISIISSGTWGTALACLLKNNRHSVILYTPFAEEAIELKAQKKHKNLPGLIIPDEITISTNLEETCKTEFILFASPSIFIREMAIKAKPFISSNQIIINVAKGIEEDSLYTMSSVIHEILPNNQVVALSGPTHAEEVALNLPTAIVASCENVDAAREVADLFEGSCVKAYVNTDVVGTEIGGALKNIIALAAGISKGLGYGDNAKAALITRGVAEIKRLGIAAGSMEQTFSGLTGVGDLIVTATSEHSRNNRCGELIGKGYSVADAKNEVGMVVEGINALAAAVKMAKLYNVETPIIDGVDQIINHGIEPKVVVDKLMRQPIEHELGNNELDILYEDAILRSSSRSSGMKRVITYGTFDLLHYGHINLLKRAKALGDYLIVAISTDEFNWNEKHKKTYFNYEQRKALLESLRYVDLVIPEEDWQQKRSDMHEYHIDTFVMGDDWKGKFDFLKEEGVEVVYLPRTPEISSSKIKKDLYDANGSDGDSKTSHEEINTDPK